MTKEIEHLISGRSAPCIYEVAKAAKILGITDQLTFLNFHDTVLRLWNETMVQKLEGDY